MGVAAADSESAAEAGMAGSIVTAIARDKPTPSGVHMPEWALAGAAGDKAP